MNLIVSQSKPFICVLVTVAMLGTLVLAWRGY